jgi:hypothetical protein
METTEVDLVEAEKVDPASADADFAEEKLDSAATVALENFDLVVEALNTARVDST